MEKDFKQCLCLSIIGGHLLSYIYLHTAKSLCPTPIFFGITLFLVLIFVVMLLTAYAWRTPFLSNRIACTEAPGNHYCTPACLRDYHTTLTHPVSPQPLLCRLSFFSHLTKLSVKSRTFSWITHTMQKTSSTMLVGVPPRHGSIVLWLYWSLPRWLVQIKWMEIAAVAVLNLSVALRIFPP